jgi:hypothetical protein
MCFHLPNLVLLLKWFKTSVPNQSKYFAGLLSSEPTTFERVPPMIDPLLIQYFLFIS